MKFAHFALNPVYDSRKSFYGKANVEQVENMLDLYSYTTRVVRFDSKNYRAEFTGAWSATTTRHIREFLHLLEDQYGCNDLFEKMDAIMKAHKIRSFTAFLREVEYMDFMFNQYRIRGEQNTRAM